MLEVQRQTGLSRLINWIIDESPLWHWITGFFVIIVFFGWFYNLLSPHGHGMSAAAGDLEPIDFWQGLYFSVVTVSSLGYGDVHPMGAAKVLVGIEVLLGLGMIGIMIVKLTSKRISYYVSRLFASEMKREIQHFTALFKLQRSDMQELLNEVGRVYDRTTIPDASPQIETSSVEKLLDNALDRLFMLSAELREHIRQEIKDRSYFVLVPNPDFEALAKQIKESFFLLGQSISALQSGLNPKTLNEVFTHDKRSKLDDIVDKQKAVCEMIVTGRQVDESVRLAFKRVAMQCEKTPDCLSSRTVFPDQVPE